MKRISRRNFLQISGAAAAAGVMAGCVSATDSPASSTTSSSSEAEVTADPVDIKISLAYGNTSRTITYNQSSPMTLSDGSVVSAGMTKPVWSYAGSQNGINIIDVTVQDAEATEMMDTASTTNFAEANIFGGNSIADKLMNYGAAGAFVAINQMVDEGKMPNIQAYFEENPAVKSAVTAYDGNVYYMPYVAEMGNAAREICTRQSWPVILLDGGATYDTSTTIKTYYEGYYTGSNARTGSNGGSVSPKDGVTIEKKTDQSIIEIQNALSTKNGATLTEALITYINDNYDYDTPSELYNGEKAAYDMDELVALFRCIKANPSLLTDGKASNVWPFFTRYSKYREDLLHYATYFGGVHVHGSDTYENRWGIDASGELYYTYSQENLFDAMVYMSQMNAEGLIYTDIFDTTNTDNFRSTLYGTDNADENPSFGFMTFDWIASTTSSSLNGDICAVLPPVAKINGVWQYYVENTRVIKPDGWAISIAGCTTEEQLDKACQLFDYYYTAEGAQLHNYGLPMDVAEGETYLGPDGIEYPKFGDWMIDTSSELAGGDVSTFLRDWLGGLMAIGYQKEIGFEYQTTDEQGLISWELVNNSNIGYPSYSGEGPAGENDYFYTLAPTVFSLTSRQMDTVSTETKIEADEIEEYVFNVIRYHCLNNAPSGTDAAQTYAEYIAYFEAAGLTTYEDTYKAAYAVMKGE